VRIIPAPPLHVKVTVETMNAKAAGGRRLELLVATGIDGRWCRWQQVLRLRRGKRYERTVSLGWLSMK
jgi:hypothetical protein